MNVSLSFWENFTDRKLVVEDSGFPRRISLEDIDQLRINTPFVEIDLDDDDIMITIPDETSYMIVHQTLVIG